MPAAGPLDPDRLAAAELSTSFRGYDPAEVRALLEEAAEALRASTRREHDLREQLGRAEQALREQRDAAAAEVEAAAAEARREGREMVAEAQRVRERMLGDLARRRRQARQQVEQLMAGRERLLESFDAARQVIEVATQDLRAALPEARQAAEAAGRRFDQAEAGTDDGEAVAALEGEIEAARLVGLPLVADEDGPGTEAAADPAGRSEGSLLGERDLREMPPVELGAEFEDVRFVPLEAEALAEAAGPDDAAPEPPADAEPGVTTEGAGDATAAVEVAESDDVAAAADATAESDDATDATDVAARSDHAADAADVAGGEPGSRSAPAERAADHPADDTDAAAPVTPDAEARPGDEPVPVDPDHLDDLFASLRAARADAVSEARGVLGRQDDEPVRGSATIPPRSRAVGRSRADRWAKEVALLS